MPMPPAWTANEELISYSIHATWFDEEFGVGFRFTGVGPPPVEIIPKSVYDAVTAELDAILDVATLSEECTEDHWPAVGECVITESSGRESTVEVWVEDQCSLASNSATR
jgi:hypothetical protein